MFPAAADAVPRPRPPQDPPPRQQRDAFFDNAKYLAIVLVAVAHAWEPLKGDSRILEGVYTVVYSFHMPAFIVISGFFSRSFDMRPDRLKRLVTGVAVPYSSSRRAIRSSSGTPTTTRAWRSASWTRGS